MTDYRKNPYTGRPDLVASKAEEIEGLAVVARTGNWADLVGEPVLPGVATEYQGALAETALQPTGDGSGLRNMTKAQVGLGNVDNTADADKPVSTATQSALDGKAATTDARFTDARAPLAHKSAHATGGADALTPADIGAAAAGAVAWKNVVSDFGADPTGVNDSTSAIQSAINSGEPVYIPGASNYYKITSPLLLSDATQIYGAGVKSQLRASGTFNAIFQSKNKGVNTTHITQVKIANLYLYANSQAVKYGIDNSYVAYSVFDTVETNGFTEAGILEYTDTATYNNLNNIITKNNKDGIRLSYSANSTRITNLVSSANTRNGVRVDNGGVDGQLDSGVGNASVQTLELIGGSIEGNVSSAIYLDGRGANITGVHIEGNALTEQTSVHANVTLTNAQQTVSTGFTTPLVPSNINFTASAGCVGTVTVNGTDFAGNTLTGTAVLNGASKVSTLESFKTITSIVFPAYTTNGDTVTVNAAASGIAAVLNSSTPNQLDGCYFYRNGSNANNTAHISGTKSFDTAEGSKPLSIWGLGQKYMQTELRFDKFNLFRTMPIGWDDGSQVQNVSGAVQVQTAGAGKNLILKGKGGFNVGIDFNGGSTISTGSTAPESSVTAPTGSIYLRSGAGTGASFYIKESGTGNTGWRAEGAPLPHASTHATGGTDPISLATVGAATLPSYASNAAAVTGGLTVGTLYRQGDFVAVVH